MRPPAVDIVIDNYNYGRYLAAAVDRALAQTYPRTEVVVVDDGSTDESRDVIASYGSRVRAVLKENGGQASAFNAGLAAAGGQVVVFLDSDDLLLPTAAGAVDALGSRPDAVKVVFRASVIDAQGAPTGRVEPPLHLPLAAGDIRAQTLSHAFDLTWPPLSAHVFRRSALAQILPIPEDDFRTLADWYLAHATSLLGQVVALERPGAGYRLHGANAYLLGDSGDSLAQIRSSIVHAQRTTAALDRIGRERGLLPPARVEVSTSTAARRLLSLRLAADRHPLADDDRWKSWRDGLRATRRRTDTAPRVRAATVAWFSLTALAPRPVVARLGQLFLEPARRGRVSKWIATRRGEVTLEAR